MCQSKCYEMKCKNDNNSRCPPGHICKNSVCLPHFSKKGEHCNTHADCVRNLWCSNKKCAAQKSLGSECKADEECDGYPRPIEQNSDFLALCQNGRCKTTLGQCSSANDCGNGVPCKSFKDDGSRKRCARGNAVGDRCKVSADCLDNLACYGGRCAEAKYKKIGDKCKDSPECRYGCGHNKKCSGPPKGGCLTDDECKKRNPSTPFCCGDGKCVKSEIPCNK